MANLSNDTQEYNLPEWFLSENVKIHEQLLEEGSGIDGFDISSKRSKKSRSKPTIQQWFCDFRNLVAHAFMVMRRQRALPFQPCFFVRTSDLENENLESYAFLDNIISSIAKELGADLISADLDDLFDVSQEFFHQRQQIDHDSDSDNEADSDKKNGRKSRSDLDSRANSPNGLERDIQDSPAKEADAKQTCEQPQGYSQIDLANFYFATPSKRKASAESLARTRHAISTIFHTPELKRLEHVSRRPQLEEYTGNSAGRALILHLRRGTDFLRLKSGTRYFTRFRDYINACRDTGQRIIMIVSTSYDVSSSDLDLNIPWIISSTEARELAFKLNVDAVSMLRLPSQRPRDWDQVAKVITHHRYRSVNTRRIKRVLRHYFTGNADVELLKYSTAWDGTLEEDASLLEEALFSEDIILKATRQIVGRSWRGSVLQLQDIFSVFGSIKIQNLEQSTADNESNDDGESEKEEQNTGDDKNLDKNQGEDTYDKIETLREKSSRYTLQKFKKSAKSATNEIKTTYDDVIIDTEVKAKINQLIRLSTFRASGKSHFLLKHVQAKGALLYGPPGTGKTHFCRAIAKESKKFMLAIDSAAMQHIWVSEYEKRIRAAFSLAIKLHPCILFIDEVDALFYRRSHDGARWARTFLVQFLKEIDGLATNEKSPFVIATTNRPDDLDEAFVRRLSHKIPFALPVLHQRLEIFHTYLKDDDIDTSVDFSFLARETAGYSGSDIISLCVQAAVIWAVEQTDQNPALELHDGPVQIKLTMDNFVTALQTSFSSVSKECLEHIKDFEARFGKHSTSKQVIIKIDLNEMSRYSPLTFSETCKFLEGSFEPRD
ncbi:MAG: hypothetical protein M1822_007295 [Bathelium mastoideum]|nr:MAG: hypothetical protein M1822_007295 [Bathelium mastoideum]